MNFSIKTHSETEKRSIKEILSQMSTLITTSP